MALASALFKIELKQLLVQAHCRRPAGWCSAANGQAGGPRMLIYRAPSFYSLRICCDRSCVSCRVSPLVVAPWASRLCKCVEASRVLHMCMMPVSSHPGGGGGGAASAASASDGAGSRPLSVKSSNRVAMAPLTEGHRALLPPPGIEPHTLILGTHPSIESLKWAEYYGHRMNAFWWIAGAALGFMRDARHAAPANIAPHLPSALEPIAYSEQCARLVSHGFAVWDVLGQCSRKGSLDSAIASEGMLANDIPALLSQFPSIRRVCFSSGASTAQLFLKHHRGWLKSTDRVIEVASNPQSAKVFGKQPWAKRREKGGENPLVLCVMLSVSPAFANPLHGGSFPDKLAQWMADCFTPGLEAHREMTLRRPLERPLASVPRGRKRSATARSEKEDSGRARRQTRTKP